MALSFRIILILIVAELLTSCYVYRAVKGTVKLTGKAVVGTVKGAYKATRGTIRFFKGKKIIPLKLINKQYYVDAEIDGHKLSLLLDTGASFCQIPFALAKELKLIQPHSKSIDCELADGTIVKALRINLKKCKLKGLTLKNVEAIVFLEDQQAHTGILGMSILGLYDFEIEGKKQQLILKNKK